MNSNDMQEAPPDLVRTTLGVAVHRVLIMTSLWILRPFIAATIWATMLVVATWPMLMWFEARLWHRRSLAVLVMTMLMLLLFVVPLMLAIAAIVEHSDTIVRHAKLLIDYQVPQPPEWVASCLLSAARSPKSGAGDRRRRHGLIFPPRSYAEDIGEVVCPAGRQLSASCLCNSCSRS